MFRKTLLISLAMLMTGACSPLSARPLVDVSVVDRDTGEWLREYPHRGDTWVAGTPGNRYGVRLSNTSGERVLVVLSVDGINAVTGRNRQPFAGRLCARALGKHRDRRLAQVAGRHRPVRVHRPGRQLCGAHRATAQCRRDRRGRVPGIAPAVLPGSRTLRSRAKANTGAMKPRRLRAPGGKRHGPRAGGRQRRAPEHGHRAWPARMVARGPDQFRAGDTQPGAGQRTALRRQPRG